MLAVLCTLALAACGDSAKEAKAPATTPRTGPRSPLELPANVPLKPARAAAAADARVVRAWSAAMRAGDVHAASALWSVPSKVQNGTPVLTLSSRAEVLFFNGSLPCGSSVSSVGGAKGFTITTFRLTERKGGDCDATTGATARTAIRVRNGKIAEWYRLPDDPDAPGLTPGAPDVEATTV
jgi:hypothetical protein